MDVKDNTERSRFELDVDGKIVFASYRRDGDLVRIPHVEAPPSLRGTGAAGEGTAALGCAASPEGGSP